MYEKYLVFLCLRFERTSISWIWDITWANFPIENHFGRTVPSPDLWTTLWNKASNGLILICSHSTNIHKRLEHYIPLPLGPSSMLSIDQTQFSMSKSSWMHNKSLFVYKNCLNIFEHRAVMPALCQHSDFSDILNFNETTLNEGAKFKTKPKFVLLFHPYTMTSSATF